MQINAKFVFERETKGAVRYAEVDKKGHQLEMADATIGTLYIRKSALNGDEIPSSLTITIVA